MPLSPRSAVGSSDAAGKTYCRGHDAATMVSENWWKWQVALRQLKIRKFAIARPRSPAREARGLPRITPGRRRERRGAVGRRLEPRPAWAVFLAQVSYWGSRQCPAAD